MAAAVTACGGGGGGSAPNGVLTGAPAGAPASAGNLSFAITAPAGNGAASLGLALKGQAAPLATVNVTAGSPGCTPGASATVCAVSVTAPAGKDLFLVSAYDGPNGTGHKLSVATVPGTIAATSANRIPLTLGTTVASVSVVLGSDGISVPAGNAASIAVTVVAFDAQNNIIAGPGNFSTPVTLTNSDTSGATSLSSTSVASAGTSVTLAYNGTSLAAATITPSIGATIGTADTFAPSSSAFVTFFLPSPTDEVYAMAQGPTGTANAAIWYSSFGNGATAVLGYVTPQGLATVNTAGLQQEYISGLTSGPGGQMWFGDQIGDLGAITTTGGTVSYVNTLANGQVNAMVAGGDGNLWFTDNDGFIGRITPGPGGTVAGATVMEWDLTQLPGTPPGSSTPLGLVYLNGSVYVSDDDGYVEQITTDGAGNATGITAVSPGCEAIAIAAGPDGNIWFTDDCDNIGMISPSNFTSGAMMEWGLGGTTPAYLGTLISSPAGLWGANDSDSNIYQIAGLSGVTPGAGPLVLAVQAFSGQNADANQLALGTDGNVWVTTDSTAGQSPPAISRVAYGLLAGGTQLGADGRARRLSGRISHVKQAYRGPRLLRKRVR